MRICNRYESSHWIQSVASKKKNRGVKKSTKQQTWKRSMMCRFLFRIYHLIMISLYENDIDVGYTPPPTCFLSPQRYVKGCSHDAAQGACRPRTELGVSLVTDITNTASSMPTTILISCRSSCVHELPSDFHCSSRQRVELSELVLFIMKTIWVLPISVITS